MVVQIHNKMKEVLIRYIGYLILITIIISLLILPYSVHLELTQHTAVSEMSDDHYDYYLHGMFLSIMISTGFSIMIYELLKD